jgi:hypothetical protein
MSDNRPNVPLFLLSQDYIAIEKVVALGTGLGNLETTTRMQRE